MRVQIHPKLVKKLLRRTARDRQLLRERLIFFAAEPFHPSLRNHPLAGNWRGYRSINLSGDLRAIYYLHGRDMAIFVEIGTHSQLYR